MNHHSITTSLLGDAAHWNFTIADSTAVTFDGRVINSIVVFVVGVGVTEGN